MKLFATLSLLCCCLCLSAQEHFYDFIHLGHGSDPSIFYSNDKYVLFTATTAAYGKELYVTDGTEAGTLRLTDMTAEKGSSAFTHFTPHGGLTFFLAYSAGENASLWYTDGTPDGTKEFYRSKYPQEIDLGTFNGYLFYQDQSDDNTYNVRRVDSSLTHDTLVGTYSTGYQYAKSNFVSTDNYVFFAFNDQMYRVGKDFGSPEKYFERSTTGVGDIPYLYSHQNTVIWNMRNSSSKTTIYAGKEAIGSHKEVDELYGYIYFKDYEVSGNFFFYTTDQLYRLNVNNLTQEEVRSTADPYIAQRVTDIGLYKGQVYFSGITSGDWELWRTGNTNAATVKLKDIASDTSSHPQDFYVANDQLFFSAYTRESGRELWKTDGSNANTTLVTDLVPGTRSSNMGDHGAVFKNELFVSGKTDSLGNELWRTDGTEANTEVVSNINTKADYGDQRVSTFMTAGDYLYLMANDSIHNTELWRTDGSQEGTIFLNDLNPGRLPGYFGEYADYKNKLYGTGVSFLDGIELFRSAGTPASSFFVTPSDLFNSSGPNSFAQLNGNLYYLGGEGFLIGSTTLFISDGTKTGTKTLYEGKGRTYKDVSKLYKVGNHLFFSAEINSTGQEPFISDGTFKGTVQISDIAASGSSEPNFFCGDDKTVYFSAKDDNGIYGIYKTAPNDADPEASLEVSFQLEGLATDFEPDTIFMYNDVLVFTAFDINYRKRLYTYTPLAQTLEVVSPDASSITAPIDFTALNGKLLFLANQGSLGQELMVTDGTADSTYMLKDIMEGSSSSEIEHLTVYNGLAFFSATSKDHGKELWMTDGTKNGTRLLWDINPGAASSNIRAIAGYKGQIYVAATEGQRQGSLYRMVVDSCHSLAPELETTSGFNNYCEGSETTLELRTGVFNDADITWFKDDAALTETGYALEVTQAGTYYAMAQKGSCAVPSEKLAIISVPNPVAKIVFDGDSTFCQGDKTTLVLEGDADLDLQWFKNNAPFGTTRQIGSGVAGDYYVLATNSYGCETTTSTVSTEILPLPNPQISLRDDTLWCSLNLDNYRWFFKGVAVSGADQKYLVPIEEGTYRVDVVNKNGCAGSSAPFRYEKIGIDESQLAQYIYPNPTSGWLQVQLPENATQIKLYDARGQLLWTQATATHINLSAYDNGIYMLVIEMNGAYHTMRVVKQAQ